MPRIWEEREFEQKSQRSQRRIVVPPEAVKKTSSLRALRLLFKFFILGLAMLR
jgi:hypothetical protein